MIFAHFGAESTAIFLAVTTATSDHRNDLLTIYLGMCGVSTAWMVVSPRQLVISAVCWDKLQTSWVVFVDHVFKLDMAANYLQYAQFPTDGYRIQSGTLRTCSV